MNTVTGKELIDELSCHLDGNASNRWVFGTIVMNTK